MKKIIRNILVLTLLVAFASCKKDETKVVFNGGTAPVLSASTMDPMVLIRPNAANHAITFSWTNPNYQFNTGISSQDVTYYLQADTTGANFTSADVQEVSVSKDLSLSFTVTALNNLLGALKLAENVPHSIDFRLKSSLFNNNAILYSQVITIVITPYLDVAVPIPPTGELYITGDGTPSSWTNSPPASQKFTQVSSTEYTITMSLTPGFNLKFLSTLGQWQPQYGQAGGQPAGTMGFNMGLPGQSDPDAIPTPAIAGTYKITVLYRPGKFTMVKQ